MTIYTKFDIGQRVRAKWGADVDEFTIAEIKAEVLWFSEPGASADQTPHRLIQYRSRREADDGYAKYGKWWPEKFLRAAESPLDKHSTL